MSLPVRVNKLFSFLRYFKDTLNNVVSIVFQHEHTETVRILEVQDHSWDTPSSELTKAYFHMFCIMGCWLKFFLGEDWIESGQIYI